MIFNGTEEQEKEYLQQVIDIINDTINSTDKSVKEHVDTLQEYKDYLWYTALAVFIICVIEGIFFYHNVILHEARM